MKKVLITLMATVFVACSMTEQEKAEKMVRNYFERNANDPSSVEIIEIHPLQSDSIYSYIQTEEHDRFAAEHDLLTERVELLTASEAFDEAQMLLDSLGRMNDEFERKIKEFVPYKRGVMTKVEYRAKNAMGALVKKTATVRFDDELTSITEFTDE